VLGCCKHSDEPAGSGAKGLVGWLVGRSVGRSIDLEFRRPQQGLVLSHIIRGCVLTFISCQ
jgi:hypothetical protein